MTSADEAAGIPSNIGLLQSSQPSHINSSDNHQSSPVSAAAGLLLALANGSTPQQNSIPPYQHTPPHLDRVSRWCDPVNHVQIGSEFWNHEVAMLCNKNFSLAL
jgi:hypothetical protein